MTKLTDMLEEQATSQAIDDPIILFTDTETTGFRSNSKTYDDPTQAGVVQLGWMLCTSIDTFSSGNFIIDIKDKPIHPKAGDKHGIYQDISNLFGHIESNIIAPFLHDHKHADYRVCHNYDFDVEFIKDMIARSVSVDEAISFAEKPHFCTMKSPGIMEFCKLPWGNSKTRLKWPKLKELHKILFDEPFADAHDALADVKATRRCYYELMARGII